MNNTHLLTNVTSISLNCSPELIDWFIGLGTILLAVVALITILRETTERRKKAELEIDIDVLPPDCHKTTFRGQMPNGTYFDADTYYCRFKVENAGDRRAEKVELMISKLYKKKKDGYYEELKDLTPLNLKWSYFGTPYVDITPKLFKHCDLLFVLKSNDMKKIFSALKSNSENKILFAFDFVAKLNTSDFIRKPGNYCIEIVASFANSSKEIKRYFEIGIKDRWEDDQDKMLKNNIFIKKIHQVPTS